MKTEGVGFDRLPFSPGNSEPVHPGKILVAITGKQSCTLLKRGVQKIGDADRGQIPDVGAHVDAVTIPCAIIKRSNDTVIPVCRVDRQASEGTD